MKAFKYLIFSFLFLFSSSAFSFEQVKYSLTNKLSDAFYSSVEDACRDTSSYKNGYTQFVSLRSDGCTLYKPSSDRTALIHVYRHVIVINCPSATEKVLKVGVNAKTYVCVGGCQYRLRACVDVDMEPGMTCDAISTGQDCGTTPPPPDTNQPPSNPDQPTPADPDPADPTPDPENTAQSESTSESSSQSQTTTTQEGDTIINNTTTTTTTNTTTNTIINLDRLENIMKNLTSVISSKLDDILAAINGSGGGDSDTGTDTGTGEGTDLTETNEKIDEGNSMLSDLKDWLTGEGEGSGIGDNPFGTDTVPERELIQQSFQTNLFGSSASCPADMTISLPGFAGGFSKTFSFAQWCYYLSLFGNFILIAAYCMGAYIIVSRS
ncbi:hypothetical protein FK538_06885 [Acinetobacter indicus]|uniref:virulence factor TspB C-terminal domain-related protein n=1 Tax=Acinetobacter indicus TaxID=756892 RepID=UPI0014401E82|nr:virulence factor TspB C-terminal domain-related protein [Acinetobacter indicus]QIZ61742.1 hypothetical protein FK538_06885 [Acinetobacter indicus]